jgi:type VI secretion system secreted protein VgrG
MSRIFRNVRAWRVTMALGLLLAFAAVPSFASAPAVNLATAGPFVVLGGSTVTNTGPSVLNGELGVAPGTSLTGFSSPTVVNGAIHDDDAVATQAQHDLTTAYNTAAGQAVPSGNVLTGQDLGGKTLTPGAYSFASSAQLTGTLTLNAEGNPDAQFVFEIGSTLTTASASSVVLINGASPCNVYWQIGSSATLGSTTAFKGNVMAHISITANTGASVKGRLLASTGAVTLDDNSIDNSMCTTSSSTPPTGTTTATTPTSPTTTTTTPTKTTTTPGSTSTSTTTTTTTTTPIKTTKPGKTPRPGRNGTATLKTTHPTKRTPCNDGFTATVRGREIKRVVFTINGKALATDPRSPFRVHVPPDFAANSVLKARVTFKDATHARTLTLRYRPCAVAVVRPLPGPSKFTG